MAEDEERRSPLECMSEEILLALLEFSDACALGRVGVTCKGLQTSASDELLWKTLFVRCQLPQTSPFASLDRPKGPDTVGWDVRVFDETRRAWLSGTILAFRAQDCAMRVHYHTSNEEQWEVDQRHQGPWHSQGQSRFQYVAPPLSLLTGAEEEGKQEAAAERERMLGLPITSWRAQYRQQALLLPKQLILTLTGHTDEVLDLAFSEDGLRLASCSRDMLTLIHDVIVGEEEGLVKFKLHSTLQRLGGGCVCRVNWSPDGTKLLTCTEGT